MPSLTEKLIYQKLMPSQADFETSKARTSFINLTTIGLIMQNRLYPQHHQDAINTPCFYPQKQSLQKKLYFSFSYRLLISLMKQQ